MAIPNNALLSIFLLKPTQQCINNETIKILVCSIELSGYIFIKWIEKQGYKFNETVYMDGDRLRY